MCDLPAPPVLYYFSVSIVCGLLGISMTLYKKLFSFETTFCPMLCLMSVLCNCTIIGLSVYFFNNFILTILPIKIAFAICAAISSAISALLAFSIFQAQKFQRIEKNRKSEKVENSGKRRDEVLVIGDQENSGFYHSLIALNVHQYLSEQVAFIAPTIDLTFIKTKKIMRIRNPSVISHLKKGKAMKLICV